MTNIKIISTLAITIIVVVAAYLLSNNHSLAPLVEPTNSVDNTQQMTHQHENSLSTATDSAAQAVKVEQLLVVTEAEKVSQAKRFLPKKASPIVLSEQELSILKEKSRLKQAEINLLIAQYGENINDQEKRQALQAKVKTLMAEYNELVLPLALKEMAEKENG